MAWQTAAGYHGCGRGSGPQGRRQAPLDKARTDALYGGGPGIQGPGDLRVRPSQAALNLIGLEQDLAC